MFQGSKGAVVAAGICITLLGGGVAAQPEGAVPPQVVPADSEKQDDIVASAIIDSKLKTLFFRKTKTSFPWHVLEGEDGSVENTLGGVIHADDLLRIEKTANCVSTHQGEHVMDLSSAISGKDGVKLTIFGGMPAYASTLEVHIAPTLRFNVAFGAAYPAPTGALRWKIKRKELRLQSATMKPGSRLRGWISVEFEEGENVKGTYKVQGIYKISGYFKPVIEGDPSAESGQSQQEAD